MSETAGTGQRSTKGVLPATFAGDKRFGEAHWDTDGKTLVWLEGRSGWGTLVAQEPGGDAPRELTREKSVRAEVGYGGGDFTVHQGVVYFVAQGESRIYRQSLHGGGPKPITPPWGHAASPVASPNGEWLAYVHEDDNGVARLAVVDTSGRLWPQILVEGADFYTQLRWGREANCIYFISWNHPDMPWDSAGLYSASLTQQGDSLPMADKPSLVAGGGQVSVFQPEVMPDGGGVVYVSDEANWGQLWHHDHSTGERRRLTTDEAEYGLPNWIQGMQTYAITADGQGAVCARCKNGYVELVRINFATGASEKLSAFEGYTDITHVTLAPQTGQIAIVGSAVDQPPRVVCAALDDAKGRVVARAASESIPPTDLGQAEAVSWNSPDKEKVYGLFYPPKKNKGPAKAKAPLLVLVHGGPTAQQRAAWNVQAQFFCTRGFAVLVPNYRGSTGYGRAYMERLREGWGILDVDDCISGARHLIDQGLVDPNRCVIAGGSAGGYTVFQALIRAPEVFAAGISYYGVTDLLALVQDTHKFEARYLDSLIGPLPQTRERYLERSPALHADKIERPVAVFQGGKDTAVPLSQADAMVANLKQRKIPHVYHVYPDEGHGFRKAETLKHMYEAIERFLQDFVLDA